MTLLDPIPPDPVDERRPGRRVPIGAAALMTLAALGVALLLAMWAQDARQRWESPRWSERRFERIALASESWSEPGERWVVAANPKCPHCRESLRELAAVRTRMTRPPRLAALIVDTEERPSEAVLAGTEVDAVFWDRDQVWRRRWGHRAYGEILCFDVGGRYLHTRTATEIGASVPDP